MTDKQDFLAKIEADIATLQKLHNAFLHEPETTFEGFCVSGTPFLGLRLLQFHRRETSQFEIEAKTIAKAIGIAWKRNGRDGKWHGQLKDDPNFSITIHDAEPANRPMELVEL